MNRILWAAAVAGLLAPFALGGAAKADSKWHDQWKIRAECDRKLAEADSYREFRKKAAECNRKLAEFRFKQREEAIKAWRESEKEWRKRSRYRGPWYHWEDD